MGKLLKIILPKTAFVNRKEQKMKTKLNQSKLKLAIVSAMLVGSAGFSTAGYAVATQTDSMQVTTQVLMSCTVDAPTLDFLTYDPTVGTDTNGTSIITSACTGGGSATITMNGGSAEVAGSTVAAPLRQMTHSSDNSKLNYQLYKENARTTIWGNDADSGKAFTAVAGDNTETVYGSITAGQVASFGSFYDFVVVTLTY
jgi:spore coat protein U-like protein